MRLPASISILPMWTRGRGRRARLGIRTGIRPEWVKRRKVTLNFDAGALETHRWSGSAAGADAPARRISNRCGLGTAMRSLQRIASAGARARRLAVHFQYRQCRGPDRLPPGGRSLWYSCRSPAAVGLAESARQVDSTGDRPPLALDFERTGQGLFTLQERRCNRPSTAFWISASSRSISA